MKEDREIQFEYWDSFDCWVALRYSEYDLSGRTVCVWFQRVIPFAGSEGYPVTQWTAHADKAMRWNTEEDARAAVMAAMLVCR